jgi:hypothetical protein
MAKKNLKKQNANKAIFVSMAQNDTLIDIIQNKATKAKEKVVLLSSLLLEEKVTIDDLIETANSQKDTIKATLIEAMEYASKLKPEIINVKAFQFVIQSLKDDAPRVKWEAAKVISNAAGLFPHLLNKAILNLLSNTEHSGNVVRWSAATALSKIILLNTARNKELIPAVEAIIQREEDNAVKKIYLKALKKNKS